METAREEDPELSAIRELFGQLPVHFGNREWTTAESIKIACDKPYAAQSFTHPELRELLLRVAGESGAISGKRLGKWLSKISGRVVAAHRLEMRADPSHGNRFSLRPAPQGALTRMGVWGLLGVRFSTPIVTVTDSFLLRNERNPRNPRNPRGVRVCAPAVAGRLPAIGRECDRIEDCSASKGKEARRPFRGLPGVIEVFMIPQFEGRRPPPTQEKYLGWAADDFVPTVNLKLGSNHRGAASIALFEDFQVFMPRGGVERLQRSALGRGS